MIGWMLALSSVVMIPLVAFYKLITTPGTLSQVKNGQSWLQIGLHPGGDTPYYRVYTYALWERPYF
jgi:hypothetical protein